MTIKAIRMFDGGFISQPFAFGGEEGKEAFDDLLDPRRRVSGLLCALRHWRHHRLRRQAD